MKTSQLLITIAEWLENPDNEALVAAESNDTLLNAVAQSLVVAASTLKKTAEEIKHLEPSLTSDDIDQLANIAQAYDESQDPALKKAASVIDELLLTIASRPEELLQVRAMEDDRIDELKKKYNRPLSEKTSEVLKAVENAPISKQYKMMEHPLSARTCPDHPGAQMARVAENTFQCDLDKKIYDYASGYTLMNGDKIPGGDVANQSPGEDKMMSPVFDSRESRLGGYRS